MLRAVGRRWGPVLQLRDDARRPEPPLTGAPQARARAPRRARAAGGEPGGATGAGPSAAADAGIGSTAGGSRRPALVATEPGDAPPADAGRERPHDRRRLHAAAAPSSAPSALWQLTAVETESRFVWTELTSTHGEPPLPQLAARFVRDVR